MTRVPHPDPLPQGEGAARRRFRLFVGADGRLRSGWLIAIFVAIVAALEAFWNAAFAMVGLAPNGYRLDDPRLVLNGVVSLVVTGIATFIASRLARQPLTTAAGLSDARRWHHLSIGAGLGILVVAVASMLPAITGAEKIAGATEPAGAIAGTAFLNLAFMIPAGAFEELAFRGFALQQFIRGTNKPIAVLATSAAFGLAHLGNAHVGALAMVNIALVGVWFALLVLRTGSLWASIGAHVAWNFCEGFVFGQPVSGLQVHAALMQRTSCASDFWCGGAFGPEASGLTALVLLAMIAATLAVSTLTDRLRR